MNFCLWDSKVSLMQQISVAFCTVKKNHYLYKDNRMWIECSLIFVTYTINQINLIFWILQVSSHLLIVIFSCNCDWKSMQLRYQCLNKSQTEISFKVTCIGKWGGEWTDILRHRIISGDDSVCTFLRKIELLI